MGKKPRNPNQNLENSNQNNNLPQDKNELSFHVEQKIKETLTSMNKKNKKELDEALGKGEFTEQLRKFFQEKYPMLLDEIENKDNFKIYIDRLKNQGFSVETLVDQAKSLDESFSESENEYTATNKSLKKLQTYCEDEKDSLPSGIFDDFARFAKFNSTPISIGEDSKIKNIGDLQKQRDKFIEDKKIPLGETDKKNINKIMSPKYAPTTRLLVSAAIKKIKKSLPKHLVKDFESRFDLPITITSEIQNLSDLKNEWLLFLQANKKNIDKDTAKELDSIKVFNQDLYEEFEHEGIEFDKTKGFGEQEQAFKLIFNKLATRQLFDEINKKNTIAEMQIENIASTFNGFPPYLNDLFKIYPYQEEDIKNTDPVFKKDIEELDTQIANIIKNGNKKESDELNEEESKKLKELKDKRNQRKREGYAKHLTTEHAKNDKNSHFGVIQTQIGQALDALIKTNFDMSKIEKNHQQTLVNMLVQKKLEKVIADGTAESLGINENRFMQFMTDFFDLSKKEVTIPGTNGDITFDCIDKSFLGGPLIKSLEIGMKGPMISEEDKKNLPLNMRLALTDDNKDYFEKSPIFADLFKDFKTRSGETVRLNDGYEVEVTNSEGKTVRGYLSNYPPKGNQEQVSNYPATSVDGSERFLYSKPITRPEDDRELLFWEKDKPIRIKENEESFYNIDIKKRELDLNGRAIGAMLFGGVVGQHSQENHLNTTQANKLESSFEKLSNDEMYTDTLDQKDNKEEKTEKKEDNKEKKEEKNQDKAFFDARKGLGGYQTIEDKEGNQGFEKGAKLLIPMFESALPPENGTKAYVNMEIVNINKEKKTFTLKVTGGEGKLGNHENKEITFSMSKEGIELIKKHFGDKIYKLPKDVEKNPNNMISILEQAEFEDANPSKFFKDLERNGKGWTKQVGDKKENIIYFGKSEIAPGEAMNADPTIETLCKVEYTAGKAKPYRVTVGHRIKDESKPNSIITEMDPINFALFIASKNLSPKTKDEGEKTEKRAEGGPNQAKIGKKTPVSISSITNLFKTISKKVGDNMKKYEDKQNEDLIDTVMFEGKIMSKLASFMPSEKLKKSFQKVGDEYIAERDNKVRAKIEDWVKFYEADPDFGGDKMWATHIEPYLSGKIPFKNHWQAAGMLLSTIKKGKGPYSRNTDRAGKGMWIKALMGEGHQQNYLKEKEKLELELKEGVNLYGQQWANDKQDEILKLEMKYIVHVVDGRQLRTADTPLLETMFSKKFASELEERSNTFFKDTASGAYNNTKDISFELARFEYFRLLGDRPQQAIANLKAVAEKAVTSAQWKVFESMVLTGMLSGVFNSMTQSDKKFIEKICRATGFLPGLMNRQAGVHHKIAKLLKLATGKDIVYGKDNEKKYDPAKFDFGKMSSTGQAKDFVNADTGFNKRYRSNSKTIQDFLSFTGTNFEGKKLIDIYEDPKTENDIKQLLGEILGKRYETNEELDNEVKSNGKSLQQNILCRNQSMINDIIKFDNGEFRGKDKDAIEDAKATRKSIKGAINHYEVKTDNDAIHMIKLFANWFEDKGFSSEGKRTLIRTLKTVKEEFKHNPESAKQILRYSIVGKIIRSSGNGQVPDELRGALEAFGKFFEKNIDKVLQANVIAEGFGQEYLTELDKKPYKIADWERYVKSTIYTSAMTNMLSKEEKKKMSEERALYKQENYLNEKIYKIAKDLDEREYGIPNAFKAMFDLEKEKKSTKQELEETLGGQAIAMKNHIQFQKAEKKEALGNEVLSEEDQELLDAEEEDDEDYYNEE